MANRTRNWSLTLNADILPTFEEMREKLSKNGLKWAFILHKQSEKVEKAHYHIVLAFEDARTLQNVKNIFKPNQPHCEQTINLKYALQYLTHKNHPEKDQYQIEDIQTNSPEWLIQNYNNENDYLNNELTLLNELLEGRYKDFAEIVFSQKYSMLWLQRRMSMIDKVFDKLRANDFKNKQLLREDERLNYKQKIEDEFFGAD